MAMPTLERTELFRTCIVLRLGLFRGYLVACMYEGAQILLCRLRWCGLTIGAIFSDANWCRCEFGEVAFVCLVLLSHRCRAGVSWILLRINCASLRGVGRTTSLAFQKGSLLGDDIDIVCSSYVVQYMVFL